MASLQWFRKILKRIASWIKSKITLERAWYLFAVSLVIFIVLSITFPDSFRLTLGISVLTITMMYLIMISSNIELQRATQTQVKAFVEQLQAVANELENVVYELSSLINVMREVQMSVTESLSVSKTALAIEEAERKRHKELIKPQIYLKIVISGSETLWGRIDTRYYHILIANGGGGAIDCWVYAGRHGLLKGYGPHEIISHKQIDVNIGHFNELKDQQAVEVQINIRDIERNPYHNTSQLSLNQVEWISLPLYEGSV